MATDHLRPQAHVGTTYKRALPRKNLGRDRPVPVCSGDLTAFPDRLLYDQRIIETWRLGMRKPRDFDAELKSLEDKAKTLKDRKVRQLGELVIATGADALDIDTLAGGLLDLADAGNAARKEGWRKRGAGFFRGGSSSSAQSAGGDQ